MPGFGKGAPLRAPVAQSVPIDQPRVKSVSPQDSGGLEGVADAEQEHPVVFTGEGIQLVADLDPDRPDR